MSTYTITFGEQAENHVGMEKIGQLAQSGLSYEELVKAKEIVESKGGICELVDLSSSSLPEPYEKAYLLIIRNGVDHIEKGFTSLLFEEQKKLQYDTKAFMYGRVVNKHARHNLCFDEKGHNPDYINKMGRIVSWNEVPCLSQIRNKLPLWFGSKTENLKAEGNFYYDVSKCGIGFHGDSERKIVVAIRLGESLPLHYQWYKDNNRIGNRIICVLNHGDIYVMSEKATGHDWKKRKIPTLRHAAGCDKFLK